MAESDYDPEERDTNSAGRLYRLLARFSERGQSNILDAWAHALEIPPDLVPNRIGDVLDLLAEVQALIVARDDAEYRDLPPMLELVKETIFPKTHQFQGPQSAEVHPNQMAMMKLRMLSQRITQDDPRPFPPDEDVDALIQSVTDVLGEVQASDLPPEIKRPIIGSLLDVLTALQTVRYQGSEAVQSAALALGGSAVFYEAQARSDHESSKSSRSVLHHVMAVAAAISIAFTHGVQIQQNLNAWNEMFHGQIALPVQPSSPLELLPGEPPAEGTT